LYIIKWSQKELAQIAEKEKQIKDQIIDTIYSQEQEKDTVIAALKKQLANDE
jgi:predicted type IV restriction endonuclease